MHTPYTGGIVRAYILSIGSELILGHLTDTNATFLAQELTALGIELLHVVQVGDDRARLTRTIELAMADADLVVCSGGVGPTEDDLTREAIADAVGETPAIDPELVATLEAFFASRSQQMPERNRKQAWLIPSASTLPNPVGTAPGWFVEREGKMIVAMPGVPREMFRMWKEQAVPRISAHLSDSVIRNVTVRTIGVGESMAEQLLGDRVLRSNPVTATYAKDDGVHVRVTGFGASIDEATAKRDGGRREVEEILGEYIYGYDDTSLEDAILENSRTRDLKLAVVDAGGGGRFASLLAMSSDAWRTLVSAELVSPSERTASELANQALRSEATVGIGIALNAEPLNLGLFQGTIEIALTGAIERTETFNVRGMLAELQRRSGMMVADVLLRAMRESLPT
jgi:nicotinamide-nucleotide amidase